MKYKVGDIVCIRSRAWIDAQEKQGIVSCGFIQDMFCYAGQVAVITRIVDDDLFNINIDSSKFCWTSAMFDPDYKPSNEPLSAKDAIRAMLDGETLYDNDGAEYHFDYETNGFTGKIDGLVRSQGIAYFDGLYRRPVKHKRLMSRWEVLGWASNDESKGWVVYLQGDTRPTGASVWLAPQHLNYTSDVKCYWKAMLLPDLSGIDESSIQQFEVEE
jgi:hypothetical protein